MIVRISFISKSDYPPVTSWMKIPREIVQFGAFVGSILFATYSIANMNQTRLSPEIVHKDPQPIDESKNEWIQTEEPVELPKFKKTKHQKNLSLQEEYAKLSGLTDWESKRVPRS
eukprot:NODE_116_length_18347_cov_2.280962.p17 type:complete len:115 gc:universal NODE_116_length_18347_cov_2.280962:1127-1471(+)